MADFVAKISRARSKAAQAFKEHVLLPLAALRAAADITNATAA
jgi:hypothetical protein